MRIVNRADFLDLPKGTVFSKYEPCIFGDLEIKGSTVCGKDFYVQQIADAVDANDSDEFGDVLFGAAQNGTSVKLDLDCEVRDGLFDADQLFAVWEKSDVLQLVERLQRAIKDAYT
ncbi:hypothetical protein [Undibacterium macrobrachii]|uniref:Uncharacterized protein n=1 Tax=Undibacterium macrobrachii TaxID=1119058 RepID=A0ABQ2X609_9BURK|nr:hypothetical protein [Undibacterium macrobrachii]GGX01476.1 hypothetical protein GCM10011282_04260 [Undibacterium macrobrachii]